MKFVIGLIILVSSVSNLTKATVQHFVSVVNADKNPPDRICGGVLVDAKWALSSTSCVESLFKSSQNVIITAGHSEDKSPNQTSKVTMIPVDKEGESIVALHLEKPITKNSMISWAKLPISGLPPCNEPKSISFQPKIGNDTSGARGFAFLLGFVFFDFLNPFRKSHHKCKKKHSSDCKSDQELRSAQEEIGPRIIKIKSQKPACHPSTGWPLMCDDTVAGIEIDCKLLNANEVERNASEVARNTSEVARNASEIETEYLSVYYYMKDIGQLLYQHKPAESPTEPPAKHSDEDKAVVSPIANAEEEQTSTVTSEASCHGSVWKSIKLFALATLLLSGILLQ